MTGLNNTKNSWSAVFFCILFSLYIFPVAAEPAEIHEEYPSEKNYPFAVGNAMLSNIFLFSLNRFIGHADFSMISRQSIYDNLTGPWQWDSSTFLVNQFGHPYQGYAYYAAGRANNLNPAESLFVTALGSYTWEVFAERVPPAINDFVSTTIGGVSLGEMIHRIYLDIYTRNRLLATIISPMDAFNDFVTGSSQRPTNSKIQYTNLSFSTSYLALENRQNGEIYSKDTYNSAAVGLGLQMRYGDPFVSGISSVFDYFDLDLGLEGGYDWYDSFIVSDGSLLSITPHSGEPSWTSYGLHLHFDYYSGSLIDFSANSLSFGLRRERESEQRLSYYFKADAGLLMFGSGSFAQNELDSENKTKISRDYGYGGMVKLGLTMKYPAGFSISMKNAHYYRSIFPGSIPNSEGSVLYNTSNIDIKHQVNDRTSVGARNSFSWEKTNREYVPDHNKIVFKVSTFMEYQL